jgi:predicted Zn-dependent peptidase
VSEEELERAKNKLRTEIHMGMATNSSLAHFIAQNELVMGGSKAAMDEIERIASTSKGEVVEVAKRYFSKNNRVVVVGKPA